MKSIKSFINKNTNIQVEELGRICLLLWKDSRVDGGYRGDCIPFSSSSWRFDASFVGERFSCSSSASTVRMRYI